MMCPKRLDLVAVEYETGLEGGISARSTAIRPKPHFAPGWRKFLHARTGPYCGLPRRARKLSSGLRRKVPVSVYHQRRASGPQNSLQRPRKEGQLIHGPTNCCDSGSEEGARGQRLDSAIRVWAKWNTRPLWETTLDLRSGAPCWQVKVLMTPFEANDIFTKLYWGCWWNRAASSFRQMR